MGKGVATALVLTGLGIATASSDGALAQRADAVPGRKPDAIRARGIDPGARYILPVSSGARPHVARRIG